MKESQYIPAPYNGISQSAPQVRLLEQAEDLLDVIVDLPDGLRRRPPYEFLAILLATTGSFTARLHSLKDPDDGSQKYLMVNSHGGVTTPYLFDMNFAAVALTVEAGAQTYLNHVTDPKAQLRISQAVDLTFLIDRTKTITVDPALNDTRPYEGLVFVKSGAYGKQYQVTVTGALVGSPIVFSVATPNGNDAGDSFWVDTDRIAQGLAGSGYSYTSNGATCTPGAALLATAGITVVIDGPVIYLSHASIDFTIDVQDGQGGIALVRAKNTVNNFSDLPARSPQDGFTVSVVPSRGDRLGAYWVKYNTNPAPGEQPWQETVAPGSEKGIDITTMPVGLAKDDMGAWSVKVLAWKQRTVGDGTTSVDPLFVGDTIEDIGYAFGRLMLVSGEEAFLTGADDPFRIYPATMTTQIDSDPISLVPPSGEARFYAATVFEKAVVVTGLLQQCILRQPGDGVFTPKTIRLETIGSYELSTAFNTSVSTALRPVGSNSKVYLPVPSAVAYMGLREMKIDRLSGEDMGDDLTAAVPKLMPIEMDVGVGIEASFSATYAMAGDTDIFHHIFRYAENQRVQNGIFPWSVPQGWTVADIAVAASSLRILLHETATGNLAVFGMEMEPKALDGTVRIFLDLRQTQATAAACTYNPISDQTTITSHLTLPEGEGYVSAAYNATSQAYPEGYLAEVVSQPTSTSVVIKGDWTGSQQFFLGTSYFGYWKPTEIFQTNPQDQRVVHGGKLTIKELHFDLSAATSFEVTITNGRRGSRTARLSQNILGSPTLYTGPFRVSPKAKAKDLTIEVYDRGHIGSKCSGFEWFAQFDVKARRSS